MKNRVKTTCLFLFFLLFMFFINGQVVFTQILVDFSGYDTSCEIAIQQQNTLLDAEWNTTTGEKCKVRINLNQGNPLFQSIMMAPNPGSSFEVIAQDMHPRFDVTIGTQVRDLWPYIFFDCVDTRPYTRYTAELDIKTVKVQSEGKRAKIIISVINAGSFTGDLVITLYSGSPLLHVEAVMATGEPWVAYIYNALLSGNFQTVCFQNTSGELIRMTPPTVLTAQKVRYRTIIASFSRGNIAVFPSPHAYIFPVDFSDNQGFVQAGGGVFGTRQPPSGDDRYRPWIKTEPGKRQHMGVFVLFSRANAEQTLEQVKQYTNADTFKEIPGYIAMTHHYHPEITLSYMDGYSTGPDFVNGMKAMKVKIAQPLEFHAGGSLNDTGTYRLDEMKLMFELCEHYSDSDFTLIPGEEPNVHLGDTHWAYMFPGRVFYTQQRESAQPFVETIQPYGTVYHLGSEDDVYAMLKQENGVGLTSHPRIKSSRYAPDNMVHRDIIKDDDTWFGADWKAMPLDLSEPRLGSRSFGVLDDFCQRGYKKKIIGEVDTFELHPDHEMYAHMNINYLKLSSLPPARDWSPAFHAIKNGDFYTSTGEVVMYSYSMNTTTVQVDLEWTFPLSFAEIISGDGNVIKRKTISLAGTREFGRQNFTWNYNHPTAHWVRFEVWDIARNGVFTQTQWVRTPVRLGDVVKSFTLINADTDFPVPGYDPLPDNAHINLAALPTRNLNIRANTNPWLVGSVRFGYDDNSNYHVENGWPYSCADDADHNYYAWTPVAGTHTITATPYTDYGAEGTAGRSLSLTFTVIDVLKGDVNGDSLVDIVDALLVAQYYVGLDPSNFNPDAADVTGDGTIDIVDALRIAQCYVGLVSCSF
ncbi:MAG: dockerin type I repeat-containing protein [Spirochaetales bacterium]|nr:dockerin type I repeat-containing protein [Spirochaetales bacterium]